LNESRREELEEDHFSFSIRRLSNLGTVLYSNAGVVWLRKITPHMYTVNQVAVVEFWLNCRIKIGCGTGMRPTRVVLRKNARIRASSVALWSTSEEI
jgi:hypothetical protein